MKHADIYTQWTQFLEDDFKPVLERQAASANEVHNGPVSDE